jgi:hypothetical protein
LRPVCVFGRVTAKPEVNGYKRITSCWPTNHSERRDQRYLSVPQAIQLSNEADVDDWFQFISGALHQYGDELLRDIPGAFHRLAHAQSERDAEYVAKMNAEYGASGPELHSF